MCKRHGAQLSKWLFKMQLLRDKISKNKILSKGLICDCKNIILTDYVTSIENFMIVIDGICQVLPHINSKECITSNLNNFQTWFNIDMFDDLYYKKNISHRILCLFQTLHAEIFTFFIKQIENIIYSQIGKQENVLSVVNELLSKLYHLTEISVFMLSGLQINGFNLNYNILKNITNYKFEDIHTFDTDEFNICSFTKKRCEWDNTSEILHIFVVDEFLQIDGILIKWIDFIWKYHCFPDNIQIILDYNLISPFDWNEKNNQTFQYFIDNTCQLNIINYKQVNFNKYYDSIKQYLQPIL